jgi:hypothetical protein
MTLVGQQELELFTQKTGADAHFYFECACVDAHDAIQVEGHQRATRLLETRDCTRLRAPTRNDSPHSSRLSLLFASRLSLLFRLRIA